MPGPRLRKVPAAAVTEVLRHSANQFRGGAAFKGLAAMDRVLINDSEFAHAQDQLGAAFPMIVDIFAEEAEKSVGMLARAMAALDAAGMIIPAHSIKGEARQFGARLLAELAERIEAGARQCVSQGREPVELDLPVRQIAQTLTQSVATMRETLVRRRLAG